MIPAFASVYDSTADNFFQTSATHEIYYLDNEFSTEQAVANAVLRDAQVEAVKTCKKCGSLSAPSGFDLTVNQTDMLVTVGLFNSTGGSGGTAQISIKYGGIPNEGNVVNGYGFAGYSIVSNTNSNSGSTDSTLRLFEQYTSSTTDHVLPMTSTELSSVRQLSDAAQGLVGGLPYQFSRMLYFSAVTATTLGFGDIVPVTVISRSLVTLEAVCGVTFAGLFLNSLSRRKSNGRSKSE